MRRLLEIGLGLICLTSLGLPVAAGPPRNEPVIWPAAAATPEAANVVVTPNDTERR